MNMFLDEILLWNERRICNFTKPIIWVFILYQCHKILRNRFKRLVWSFITRYITPHEENFLFCNRKMLRHFDEYLKRCSSAHNLLMELQKSIAVFFQNSWKKMKKSGRLSVQVVLQKTTSSRLICWNIWFQEVLSYYIKKEILEKYRNQRISINEWKVTLDVIGSSFQRIIFPIFKRVCIIKYDNGYFCCDCYHFEPCSYQ